MPRPRYGKPQVLRKRREFLRVQGQGHRFKSQRMVLLVLQSSGEGTRVGLTVSRKVGNAVVRNRVRRQLREILRTQPQALCPNHDHVVVAFYSAANADFAVLREELTCLLDQARRWALDRSSSSA